MATVKLIENVPYEFKVYGSDIIACTKVGIKRPLRDGDEIRWTYNLGFQVKRTKRGYDGKGNRASGFADAAVISAVKQPHKWYPLVTIGDTIVTPFGAYVVRWFSLLDNDNLQLIEVRDYKID